jgi:hypothetical protein
LISRSKQLVRVKNDGRLVQGSARGGTDQIYTFLVTSKL